MNVIKELACECLDRLSVSQNFLAAWYALLTGCLSSLRRFGKLSGPYVLLELLLPGGTLFALLLFIYRRKKLRYRARLPLNG